MDLQVYINIGLRLVKTWTDDDPKAALMERKRALIVDAALRDFLENGYADGSVNRIAADAGVSIKTLYRHFESKEELFSAVMQAACERANQGSPAESSDIAAPAEPSWFRQPPAAALPVAGESYLRHALSDEQLALYRVVTRDAHKFPELGLRYRQQVTGSRDELFANYLERWLPQMEWRVTDKRRAAAIFTALLKVELFDDALQGLRKPTGREIAKRAREAAVQMLTLFESGKL